MGFAMRVLPAQVSKCAEVEHFLFLTQVKKGTSQSVRQCYSGWLRRFFAFTTSNPTPPLWEPDGPESPADPHPVARHKSVVLDLPPCHGALYDWCEPH